MIYRYNIAEIEMEVKTDMEVEEISAFEEFICRSGNRGKEKFELSMRNTMESPVHQAEADFLCKHDLIRVYQTEKGIVREFLDTAHHEPYAWLLENRVDETYKVLYNIRGKKILKHMGLVFELLGSEMIFAKYKTLILHSSYIRYKGEAILFTAPSGTGKSTQADLWNRYLGAEILNGDRAAVAKSDGTWWAYGLPFAGSSKIFRNIKTPIRAIVILRQGGTNEVKQITPADKFKYLYQEIIINNWNREYINTIISLISEIIYEIPVFMYYCTPDQEAVYALKKELDRMPVER